MDSETGVRLREYRLQRGLSQEKLELELGLASGHISRIESGRLNPTKETLIKIARILGLDGRQQALLFGVSNQPPDQEEFNTAWPYIQKYIEESANPILVSDVCGFSWAANSKLYALAGIPEILIPVFNRKHRPTHILTWFFNPQSPFRKILSESELENMLLNQVSFFLDLVDYPVRKNEPWLVQLIYDLCKYKDFNRIFEKALEHINQGHPLTHKQSHVKVRHGNEYKEFIIMVTPNFRYPKFVFSEFMPDK